jgi:hypothetical protein
LRRGYVPHVSVIFRVHLGVVEPLMSRRGRDLEDSIGAQLLLCLDVALRAERVGCLLGKRLRAAIHRPIRVAASLIIGVKHELLLLLKLHDLYLFALLDFLFSHQVRFKLLD